MRENLFNILAGGNYGTVLHNAHILDLFAGTGTLGLEALSRGAKSVCFVEKDHDPRCPVHDALSTTRANIARLKRPDDGMVIAGNALSLKTIRHERASLIFADAPYDTHDGLLAVIHLRSIGAFAPGALGAR